MEFFYMEVALKWLRSFRQALSEFDRCCDDKSDDQALPHCFELVRKAIAQIQGVSRQGSPDPKDLCLVMAEYEITEPLINDVGQFLVNDEGKKRSEFLALLMMRLAQASRLCRDGRLIEKVMEDVSIQESEDFWHAITEP